MSSPFWAKSFHRSVSLIRSRVLVTSVGLLIFHLSTQVYGAKSTPSISNQEWERIAGNRISQTYAILKGDSLARISRKLFGSQKFWPKIWALNNQQILNPHLIFPGKTLAFNIPVSSTRNFPSHSSSLVLTDAHPLDAPTASKKTRGRSQEWKQMPTQSWEKTQVILTAPIEIDPHGISRNTIMKRNRSTGFEPRIVVSNSQIPYIGRIAFGPETRSFGMFNNIFIHSKEIIQVGTTYAITNESATVTSPQSGRTAYVYPILGKVKIIGVRESVYIGTVVAASGLIQRGHFLIPLPVKVPRLQTILGPSSLTCSVISNPFSEVKYQQQFSEVILDLGSNDGIQPGMVFKAFEHDDPFTQDRISRSDFIVRAKLMVIGVTENFSHAIITSISSSLGDLTSAVLVTDINDLTKDQAIDLQPVTPEETESLDLESPSLLSPNEEKDLKDLEEIKSIPSSPNFEPSPSPSPSPIPSATSSPAAEGLPDPNQSAQPAADTPPSTPSPTPKPSAQDSSQAEPIAPPPPAGDSDWVSSDASGDASGDAPSDASGDAPGF